MGKPKDLNFGILHPGAHNLERNHVVGPKAECGLLITQEFLSMATAGVEGHS